VIVNCLFSPVIAPTTYKPIVSTINNTIGIEAARIIDKPFPKSSTLLRKIKVHSEKQMK
jgi:hypothetical protein